MYVYKILGKCKIIHLLKALTKIVSVLYNFFSFCIDLLTPYSVKDPLQFFSIYPLIFFESCYSTPWNTSSSSLFTFHFLFWL